MNSLSMLGENVTEDLWDEFISCSVNNTISSAFGKKKQDESCQDEALQSAISTLEISLRMYAIQSLTKIFYDRFITLAGALYVYISGGSLLGKIKSKVSSKGLVGKSVGKLIGSVVDNRTQKAKIAMNFVKEHEQALQESKKSYQKDREYLTTTVTSAKGDTDNKNLNLFTIKTKTGTWSKSSKDRKVYEKATGYKLKAGESWSKLSQQLNQFQEFATDTENKIVNLAQAQLDNLTTLGVEKVR